MSGADISAGASSEGIPAAGAKAGIPAAASAIGARPIASRIAAMLCGRSSARTRRQLSMPWSRRAL